MNNKSNGNGRYNNAGERISTGIPGMDDLMEGGLVKGSTNLVAGMAGTGKTIFGCQYLWHGIQKGENGLYITLEESAEDVLNDVTRFGWDFQDAIDEGKCNIIDMKSIDLNELRTFIANEAKALNATRFVLDSLSIASMNWKGTPEEVFKIRMGLFDLLRGLKSSKLTSILISEMQHGRHSFGPFGFESFLVDGIIVLQLLVTDAPIRGVQILKMRRTNHSVEIFPFSIAESGITIKKM